MSSQRRLRANQANARLSTGPQTPEGKARSSQNARKHGLSAREVVIAPGEREEFDDFLASYQDELQPQGMVEQVLSNQLVFAAWNLRRISRLEAALATGGDLPASAAPALYRLARYHARADRAFLRSLRELRALQTNRALRDALPAADSAAEPEAQPLPPLASIAECAPAAIPLSSPPKTTPNTFNSSAEARRDSPHLFLMSSTIKIY